MLIAYRDYVAGSTVSSGDSDWEAGAPLSNITDRRLALVARRSSGAGFTLSAAFSSNTPIGVIAILAHNFVDPTEITGYFLRDASNALIYGELLGPFWLPANTQFPRHVIFVLPQTYTNVRRVEVGILGATGRQIGRFWAGPLWTAKTTLSDFECLTRDESVINRSLGQQVYADVKQRYRQLRCSIPSLTEREAIGVFDGSVQNLQDIAFEVGRTGEVIVIPSDESQQIINKFGVYGHFLEAPGIRMLTKNESGRYYTSSFEVVEDL